MLHKTKILATNILIRILTGSVIGMISGLISGVITGILWDYFILGLPSVKINIIFLPALIGIIGIAIGGSSGGIINLLSLLANDRLFMKYEWAIINGLGVGIYVIFELFEVNFIPSFHVIPKNHAVATVVLFILIGATIGGAVEYFTAKLFNDKKEIQISGRTIATYVLGILLIPMVVYKILKTLEVYLSPYLGS